jgi:hypothetical protein
MFLLFSSNQSSADIVLFDKGTEIRLNSDYIVKQCGGVTLAECSTCFDIPNYYFYTKTKELISNCGGACWHPTGEQKEICENLCPPNEWRC